MVLVYQEMILMIVMAIMATLCTYLGLVLHQKKYAHHVMFDQPTKLQKRLLEHPYIHFLVMLLFVIFYGWFLAEYVTGTMQQFFFGAIIAIFSILFGQSLGGILIFLYAIKNPEKITGQTIFKDKKFRTLHLQAALMPCLILLISLTIMYHTAFILGSLVAAIMMLLAQLTSKH